MSNDGLPQGMDEATFEKFNGMCCELSPENLHCDGEISRAAAQRRYNAIMKRWRTLEKTVGRKVSQEEIEMASIQRYNMRRRAS